MASRISPTLLRSGDPLASTETQRKLLAEVATGKSFADLVAGGGHRPLRARGIAVLQMNLGKKCNQTCRHCHVDAGPEREEVMTDDVMDACLSFLAASPIATVDVTGGAPELHPRFRELVRRCKELGRHVMDRCNLTITGTAGHADLPQFLAAHGVEVVASLPAPWASGTDAQRGAGVFAESIEALRRFNALGYAQEGSGLVLNLITNPVGAFLPGNQAALERDWKRELERRHGVRFNHLYTITNMPISRFLSFLLASGNFEAYMEKLVAAFNPAAVEGLMCRTTLSVGWDGKLYDCDFNQMLDMALEERIDGASFERLASREIQVASHCFGCTAGAGSSCGGTTT